MRNMLNPEGETAGRRKFNQNQALEGKFSLENQRARLARAKELKIARVKEVAAKEKMKARQGFGDFLNKSGAEEAK